MTVEFSNMISERLCAAARRTWSLGSPRAAASAETRESSAGNSPEAGRGLADLGILVVQRAQVGIEHRPASRCDRFQGIQDRHAYGGVGLGRQRRRQGATMAPSAEPRARKAPTAASRTLTSGP